MNEQIKNWLINYPATAAPIKMNLICFPFAGGGTVNYGRWRAELHETIDLYAFNFPGRERFFNQHCLTDYSSLIADLSQLLRNKSDIPFVFFGHSFGGLTAYFTALELKKINAPEPRHVFISARVPPNTPLHKIADLNDQQFTSALIERYQGIPEEILKNPQLMQLFIPIIQKDFKLYEQYPALFSSYADQKISCDMTTISYTDDSHHKEAQMHDWQNYTQGMYQHIELPGGHFEILYQWKNIVALINQLIVTP